VPGSLLSNRRLERRPLPRTLTVFGCAVLAGLQLIVDKIGRQRNKLIWFGSIWGFVGRRWRFRQLYLLGALLSMGLGVTCFWFGFPQGLPALSIAQGSRIVLMSRQDVRSAVVYETGQDANLPTLPGSPTKLSSADLEVISVWPRTSPPPQIVLLMVGKSSPGYATGPALERCSGVVACDSFDVSGLATSLSLNTAAQAAAATNAPDFPIHGFLLAPEPLPAPVDNISLDDWRSAFGHSISSALKVGPNDSMGAVVVPQGFVASTSYKGAAARIPTVKIDGVDEASYAETVPCEVFDCGSSPEGRKLAALTAGNLHTGTNAAFEDIGLAGGWSYERSTSPATAAQNSVGEDILAWESSGGLYPGAVDAQSDSRARWQQVLVFAAGIMGATMVGFVVAYLQSREANTRLKREAISIPSPLLIGVKQSGETQVAARLSPKASEAVKRSGQGGTNSVARRTLLSVGTCLALLLLRRWTRSGRPKDGRTRRGRP
jgi:hypothetical protein